MTGRARPEAPGPDADRRSALGRVPVSRETEARFAIYADLLRRWQSVKNLVGPGTLDVLWTRHLADSAQIVDVLPAARRWVDMGSGAGFPGLVVAIRLAGSPDAVVHLIEANGRKCAFLREAARETQAPAIVHHGRVEDVAPDLRGIETVTARALAPLPRLVEIGGDLLRRGALGLFLKSRDELDGLRPSADWAITSLVPSRTSPDGRIVLVRWRSGAFVPPEREGPPS